MKYHGFSLVNIGYLKAMKKGTCDLLIYLAVCRYPDITSRPRAMTDSKRLPLRNAPKAEKN